MSNEQPEQARASMEFEVPFHDTDPLGIVWHGHYLKYFEIARTKLLRSWGLDARDVMGMGFRVVVAETRCRHAFPLHYGDRFRVDVWLVDFHYRLLLAYEVWNLTHNRRSARGRTSLVCTDLNGELRLATPEPFLDKMRAASVI